MTTALHEERMAAVLATVAEMGARTVLDLGCGDGDLILRLATMPGITRITGIEIGMARLRGAEARLAALPEASRSRVQLACASLTEGHPALTGYDCACLVEVIEHLPPADINRLERAVFTRMRPAHVIVTTPNAEYNPVLGVPASRMRHPEHQFEWDRARFARWAGGVAARTGYDVACRDICGAHPQLGGASQMAVFSRLDARGERNRVPATPA
ncbi:methyltransferase [Roseovarius autotrophicus]|uniref:methyltransferase n=1 Tax=Roseovarius autotrophicus TaxID=2824121 RepID=UPI0019EDA45A|nr:methyltransferase [Roseovarius autotrophicus]MBE0454637.1 methyltransferase domain-containing protein [Roseovarius sp.]